MKKFLLSATAVLLSASAVPAMAAHDLPPGDTGSPISTAPLVLGAKLNDTGLQTINVTGPGGQILNVDMRSAVFQGDGTYLDFVYQVRNNAVSTNSVEGLTTAPFGNFAIPGVWQTLTGFDAFLNGNEEGDSARRLDANVVGLDFGSALFNDVDAGVNALLNPGETSAIFIVRVNAPSYTIGSFTAQDGLTADGIGFAPAVPEPATWAMMIGGFGLLGAAARRSRRATTVLA